MGGLPDIVHLDQNDCTRQHKIIVTHTVQASTVCFTARRKKEKLTCRTERKRRQNPPNSSHCKPAENIRVAQNTIIQH